MSEQRYNDQERLDADLEISKQRIALAYADNNVPMMDPQEAHNILVRIHNQIKDSTEPIGDEIFIEPRTVNFLHNPNCKLNDEHYGQCIEENGGIENFLSVEEVDKKAYDNKKQDKKKKKRKNGGKSKDSFHRSTQKAERREGKKNE